MAMPPKASVRDAAAWSANADRGGGGCRDTECVLDPIASVLVSVIGAESARLSCTCCPRTTLPVLDAEPSCFDDGCVFATRLSVSLQPTGCQLGGLPRGGF